MPYAKGNSFYGAKTEHWHRTATKQTAERAGMLPTTTSSTGHWFLQHSAHCWFISSRTKIQTHNFQHGGQMEVAPHKAPTKCSQGPFLSSDTPTKEVWKPKI